jgi:hypothetical protein
MHTTKLNEFVITLNEIFCPYKKMELFAPCI